MNKIRGKMLFEWDEKYSIENKLLDDEHKELFELAEEAFIPVSSDKKRTKIKKLVIQLHKLMSTHFANEEKFMEDIQYPEMQRHLDQHHQIIEMINDLLKSIPSMDINSVENKFANTLKNWIINHILVEDKNIGDWVRTNKS